MTSSVTIPMPIGTQPPARSRFVSRWAFRDKVHVDDDRSITAIVTGFSFSESGVKVCLNWFANGDNKEAWFEEWRLSEAGT